MASLNVRDSNGQFQKGWSFKTFKNIYNCGGNLPAPRRISGWSLTSPDGVERSCEGNWQQFVPFVQLIVSNYGCTSNIS